MEYGLQKPNADQRLAVWTQRIADRRSSGKSVRHWCQDNDISEKTYYYWQRRIYRMAQEQQAPEFAELHSCRPVSSVAASLKISGMNVQIYAGADEPTLSALFRALSSC